ncbi:MAG: hypothetical protein CMM47_03305 [Rhodospirillaceae bacterium]|nr:hypothetical protein [Rhodospirillaceae bacterium]
MTIGIKPLSEALGVEVTGLDTIAVPKVEDLELLKQAFLERHLLCVRSRPLTPKTFSRFASYFGRPQLQLLRDQRDGDVPEVSILDSTYKTADAKPDDLTKVRLSGWHTDDSYFAKPAKVTALQGLAVPSTGGQTRFANTHMAYDELPEDRKTALNDMSAVHAYDTRRATARARTLDRTEQSETSDVIHPLIRTHDESGVKAIYFNPNRTDRVMGMDLEESDVLLDELYGWITQPKYQYHHEWIVGDILLWDNRCLIHSVNVDFPIGEERRHQRILLQGDRPV